MVDWGRETFLFVSSIVYAVLGCVLLMIAFRVVDMVTPEDLRDLIFEKGNLAAAVVVGAFLIGLSIIIAAAIH